MLPNVKIDELCRSKFKSEGEKRKDIIKSNWVSFSDDNRRAGSF